MNVSVRPYLTSGLAVITAGAIITAPTEPQQPAARAEALPVALAAQELPLRLPAPPTLALPAQLPVGLPAQLPALLVQQVTFNSGVAVDFVVTGAQLIGRQLESVGTLVDDIRNGTPVPVAVGRAVVSFIDIELDAGRELVGFGEQLVDFQIEFVGNLVAGLPPVVAIPAGQALALSAGAVDAFSDFANEVIDDLDASLPTPGANAQVKSASGNSVTESTRQASLRLGNIVPQRRDHPKSTAVERDSAITTKSHTGDTEGGVAHRLRDALRRNLSTSVSSTADKPGEGGEHQQRHRRDRQQDNSGNGEADHRTAND
jgi:hypothetical protein